MAGNSDVKKLIVQLEKVIEDGLTLFKIYKLMSKKFQEQQKNLTNNKFKNLLDSIKIKRTELMAQNNLS